MELSTYDEPQTCFEEHERSCLKCGTSFQSAWTGERICKRCKQSSDWKQASPYEVD
jgi:hypothetical protein